MSRFYTTAAALASRLLPTPRSLTVPRLSLCTLASTGGTEPTESHPFFRYTTGRWFYNEEAQQKMRYLAFDVDALKAAAVAAVEGAQSVVQMAKLPEGSYSRTFLITLDNQKEIIARLPTPSSPPHYATASEVATMEFARTRLGLPVPRMLSWSSTKDGTAVGAEFIIMEKAVGVEVSKLWPKMSLLRKYDFIREVFKIEMAALDNPLPCYGSIFYRGDVAPEKSSAVDDVFAIGPTMERSFWKGEREGMDVDRGPWKTPSEYLYALCHQEQEWMRSHASSQPLRPFLNHPVIIRDPSAHLAVLDHFHSVIPDIIPFGSPRLVQPTFWHHDLSASNIFISEEDLEKGQISITSVTDWRNTWVGPLYRQACVPKVFRYPFPWKLPEGLEIASLPPYADKMSEVDRTMARDDADEMNLEIFYRAIAVKDAPFYYDALVDSYNKLFSDLALTASFSWDKLFHILRLKLLTLQSIWPNYRTTPCPFLITKEEERTWRSEAQQWQNRQDQLELIYDEIGMDEEGWVAMEDFETACETHERLRKHWINIVGEDWPFSDPSERTATPSPPGHEA